MQSCSRNKTCAANVANKRLFSSVSAEVDLQVETVAEGSRALVTLEAVVGSVVATSPADVLSGGHGYFGRGGLPWTAPFLDLLPSVVAAAAAASAAVDSGRHCGLNLR